MAKAAKKQKQTKKAKKRRIVEVIPGASDADARAALREELEAHAARYRDPSEFAAETEQTLLALESRADAEAKARQAGARRPPGVPARRTRGGTLSSRQTPRAGSPPAEAAQGGGQCRPAHERGEAWPRASPPRTARPPWLTTRTPSPRPRRRPPPRGPWPGSDLDHVWRRLGKGAN